ncbi:hypothetical protein BC940DRAFT_308481 [Gongronella butleri]|nr:hypothetical protein BC940DRAFT_308481 [Gongronella butleri]
MVELFVRLPVLKQPLAVNVDEHTCLKDLVYSLCQRHHIPPYYAIPIFSALSTALKEQAPKKRQRPPRQHFVDTYQEHTLQYYNKHDQDDFSRAFYALVKCPLTSIFDALLQLEQSYAMVMRQLVSDHQDALTEMQARHAQEMEAPQHNMTHLFTKHVEEMELAQATYASDVLQLQQSQRQEYCEFVMELHREYMLRAPANNKAIHSKDLIAAAASRVWKKEPASSSSSLSSSTSGAAAVAAAENKRRASQQSVIEPKMVQDIQEMGFSKDQAEAALALTKGTSVEQAINLLVEHPKQVDDHVRKTKRRSLSFSHLEPMTGSSPMSLSSSASSMASPPPPPPPPPPSSSSSSSQQPATSQQQRRRSLQKPLTPPTSKNKAWNPISFLQQQKQAMENTNLSSVRKLGGWLGKAMENLGIDQEESALGPLSSSQLVESFTITLGSAQIKSTHNLRLMVTDMLHDMVDPPLDEQREMGYKAQNALRLYTRQLSALIVLVEKKELLHDGDAHELDWRKYKTGKGSNRALFDRCQRSTDFHFATIESQLDVIAQDMQENPHVFQEGAFFITKHSQLPMHQIVFHLIIDGDDLLSADLSTRHPLMVGLRNILRVCSRYDINSLSVPLLLLPDRYLDQPEVWMPKTVDAPQMHANWLARRSDSVMKTVKGYMMEASRGKQSHGEMQDRMDAFTGLHNVEFFIPMHQQVYMADNSAAPAPADAAAASSPAPAGSNAAAAPPSLMNVHASSSSSLASLHASASSSSLIPSAPATPTTAAHHHPRTPTPQVEQVFQQLRAQLVQLFRTS